MNRETFDIAFKTSQRHLPSHIFQLLPGGSQGVPKPDGSLGSSLGSPPIWLCPENHLREMPYQMPKPRQLDPINTAILQTKVKLRTTGEGWNID